MNVDLFRAATNYALDVTSGLTSVSLGCPTPCDGWDTGTVVRHLSDVATALVGLVETGELRMPSSSETATDPVAKFHASLARLRTTLAIAGHTKETDAAMQAATIEFTMHGWDIGVASYNSHAMPTQLATDVLALATSLIDDDVRGANFAARIAAPTTAQMGDRLAAFLGRRRVGPPSHTVATPLVDDPI